MDILKRPMLLAAVVCSVVAAISLFELTVAFVILALSIIVMLFAIIGKHYKYIVVLFTVILFTVSLIFQFVRIDMVDIHHGEMIRGRFLVTEEPSDYGEYNTVTLKTDECDAVSKGVKILAFDYKKTKFKMGDIINANLKLSSIEKNNKYRISDYGSGIYATANSQKLEATGEYNFLYKAAGEIRNYVKKTVSTRFSGDTAGLLLALTTGEKSLLSDKFLDNVKTTGISHVIVVSGMHLSIIMAAVFWCLDRLFYNKYIRALLSVFMVVLISAVCGFTMSIIRAGAMFVIAGLAPVFNRENDSLNSLLTAVTVVLIGAPFAVVNVSFQLSVLSTLALVWIVPFYYKIIIEKFNISSKIIKSILAAVLCSVFAIIFTLPVTIRVFGYVSVVAPITNIIISYPIMIALIFNVTALLIFAVPIIKVISYPLFGVAGLCSKFIIIVVNKIAKLPITVAVLPKSAFWLSIVLIAAVIGYLYYYKYKKKRSDFNANRI